MAQVSIEKTNLIVNTEQQKLLQDKLLHSAHPNHALRFELLAFCGFQPAEASTLRVKDVLKKNEVYLPNITDFSKLRSQRYVTLTLSPVAVEMINSMTKGLSPNDNLFTSIVDGKKIEITHTAFYLVLRYHASRMFGINVDAEILRICYLYNQLVLHQGDVALLSRKHKLGNSNLYKKAVKIYKEHNAIQTITDPVPIAAELSNLLQKLLYLQQKMIVVPSLSRDTARDIMLNVNTMKHAIDNIQFDIDSIIKTNQRSQDVVGEKEFP